LRWFYLALFLEHGIEITLLAQLCDQITIIKTGADIIAADNVGMGDDSEYGDLAIE